MGTPTLREYTLAQLSNHAYRDESDIRKHGGLPSDWVLLKQRDTNATTGFVAHVYINERSQEIVIAYRGSELDMSMIDWKKADVALAKDATPQYIEKLDQIVPGDLKNSIQKSQNWDIQFTQGLEFARQMIEKYGDSYKISVTGHSLGGSIAQVVSKMHGLTGVTFDPAGAKNIVNSEEFRGWARAHGIEDAGSGSRYEPANFIVNGSPVSNQTGSHIGLNHAMSGVAHRKVWQEAAPEVWSRHSMDRILSEFKEAYTKQRPLNEIGMLDQKVLHAENTPQNPKGAQTNALQPEKHPLLIHAESLLAQTTQAVEKRYKADNCGLECGSKNVSMVITAEALARGMDSIDQVVLIKGGKPQDHRFYAIQGNDIDTGISIKVLESQQKPVSESLAKINSIIEERVLAASDPSHQATQKDQGQDLTPERKARSI